MSDDGARPEDDLPCAVFVEMVTDYLDGSVPPELRTRIDEHLAICPGCTSVLAQIQQVIGIAGRLTEDDVDTMSASEREELLAAFRAARRKD
jgi:predicted anti-sigma-YlaC factor YlaD